eukprot:TRINITY_DN214_c0_g1_i1.p1 TRINITY_DN214_c0_g1~~TRINITY_DN214_c0_g1_i1.p1  ORF type:complete len:364 (+),score=186.46 TRINITY_DN214_c0_g1_i1:81-1094(+)
MKVVSLLVCMLFLATSMVSALDQKNCSLIVGATYVRELSTIEEVSVNGWFVFGTDGTNYGVGTAGTIEDLKINDRYFFTYQYAQATTTTPTYFNLTFVVDECASKTDYYTIVWENECQTFQLKPNNGENLPAVCASIAGNYSRESNCEYQCELQNSLRYITPQTFRQQPSTFVASPAYRDPLNEFVAYSVFEYSEDFGAYWMEWLETSSNNFEIKDLASLDVSGKILDTYKETLCSSYGNYKLDFVNCTEVAFLRARNDPCLSRFNAYDNLELDFQYFNCTEFTTNTQLTPLSSIESPTPTPSPSPSATPAPLPPQGDAMIIIPSFLALLAAFVMLL